MLGGGRVSWVVRWKEGDGGGTLLVEKHFHVGSRVVLWGVLRVVE